MKKYLILLLALMLALSLSMPALAFTSDTSEEEDHPYKLSIYLVEYDDNDFFGLTSLPPSDRGYAKNEIVAAVVELYVPDDEAVVNTDYPRIVFGGENVDLDVADNYNGGAISLTTSDNIVEFPAANANVDTHPVLNADDEIEIYIGELKGEDTFRWLFFAKVTDDDASLYAKLINGLSTKEFQQQNLFITLDGVLYSIQRRNPDANGEFQYVIAVNGGDYNGALIFIQVDEDNVSLGMTIQPNTADTHTQIALGVNTHNELGIVDPDNPAKILTSGDMYDDVMDVYNDVVVDVFHMDYFKIGNYVRDSYFENLVSPDTIIATVDIAPFTAYVTVPDNIVTDPPKTGDAASMLGFVMLTLSAAGAAALRKRG